MKPNLHRDGTTIIDKAGRTVSLPNEVRRVVSLHPVVTHLVWRLAPQKLVNVDRLFQARLRSFLCPPQDLQLLQSLPVTGVYSDPPGKEKIASLEPDLIITMTSDPNVDKYQETCACPVITANKANLRVCSSSFRVIGEALGNPAGGSQLSSYWDNTIDRVTDCTSQIPMSDKLKVYYSSHNALLTTPGTSTVMSSILDLAGTVGFSSTNPDANIEPTNESGKVSLEQLTRWNPDVIVASSADLPPQIMSNSDWQGITAVINRRVYANPVDATFDGIKSLMGLVWISTLVYPNIVTLNFLEEVRTYYELFNKVPYHQG